MITALDTNVLVDFFTRSPAHGAASRDAIRAARSRGGLIACEVVWAEVAAGFGRAGEANEKLLALGIDYSPLRAEAAEIAGTGFREYRSRGGRRTRVIADFLIGAHAAHEADLLLTRDRGFFRTYFSELTIEDPTSAESTRLEYGRADGP